LHKGKLIIIASLAALALPPAAAAQTRTRRTPAAKPAARRAAPAAKPPAGGVNLTAEDMSLLVEGLNFNPEIMTVLATKPEERKTFAADVRRMIATAAEARAEGYAERPDMKLQLELGRALVIAKEHFRRQEAAGVKDPALVVSEAESYLTGGCCPGTCSTDGTSRPIWNRAVSRGG